MDTSLEETSGENTSVTPLALQEPQHARTLGWQLLYWVANATIGLGNITFYTILLPAKIASVIPTNQTNAFIIISGVGAVASILTNPVVGALSDRTTSRLGRRFPWLLTGMALVLIAMLTLAGASTPWVLGAGSVVLQIAINMLLAALSAVIPDQVPIAQRATIGAFGGMAPLVGGLLGQILVGQIHDTNTAFLDLGLISAILLIAFSLVFRETPLPKDAASPFRLADIPRSLWLSPHQHPEFALVWIARCLVFLASTTVINYLFYYLQAERLFSLESASGGVQQFFTIYVLAILCSSLIGGKLSDLLQQRKPFVIGGSLLMAAGVAILAFVPLWPAVLVASGMIGAGFGTYLACDLALASQLLPSARNRGKDFGLINMAIFFPMLLATGIASLTLGLFQSYTVLLSIIAVGTALAAMLIVPVKSVR